MLNQKISNLSPVVIEVIDALIGYDDEEKIRHKARASKRTLAARRAIEEHREKRSLAKNVDEEAWFDDI